MNAPTDDQNFDGPHLDGQAPPEAEGLTGILDALAAAIGRARAMPMSSSVLVSRAELLDLVEQARSVLPTQLIEADDVLAAADDARARAEARAEAIVADATEEAARLVSQEQVVLQATERAADIVAEAELTATRLRREADDYCDRRLADFEIDLGRIVAQVQAGRAKLAGQLGEPG